MDEFSVVCGYRTMKITDEFLVKGYYLSLIHISAGCSVQREPHAGGGEQRWQDQRGYKESERAVAERSDQPLSLIHISGSFMIMSDRLPACIKIRRVGAEAITL